VEIIYDKNDISSDLLKVIKGRDTLLTAYNGLSDNINALKGISFARKYFTGDIEMPPILNSMRAC
jgi:hypothetical protein